MLPVPDAAHLPPLDPAHVHVTVFNVAGNASVTVAPVTALGPALVAVIEYERDPPQSAPAALALIVIDVSAVAPSPSALLWVSVRSCGGSA
jgi:hypothetical protein